MSDTIEVAAQTAENQESDRHPKRSDDDAIHDLPARDLVQLAQGFYFIFWGLLTAVLFGIQALVSGGARVFADLFLGAGVLATLVGTWRLHQAKSLGELWIARTRSILILAGLLAYFCLFFYMWRRAPASTYLLVNVFAFTATVIVYVVMFGRAVAALATAFGRKRLALESRVFSAGNVGLLLLPLTFAVGYILVMSLLHKSDPVQELQSLLSRANLIVIIVLLLPFSLTLSLAWACKDAVVRQLSVLDRS